MFALVPLFVPQQRTSTLTAEKAAEKKTSTSRAGSWLIESTSFFFSAAFFKQVWRDLSVPLQFCCLIKAHCSLPKESFSAFLCGDLDLFVLSTHHAWSAHDLERRDVVGFSRNQSIFRTGVEYQGPEISTASTLG